MTLFLEFSPEAEVDLDDILEWSATNFGEAVRNSYEELINTAIEALLSWLFVSQSGPRHARDHPAQLRPGTGLDTAPSATEPTCLSTCGAVGNITADRGTTTRTLRVAGRVAHRMGGPWLSAMTGGSKSPSRLSRTRRKASTFFAT
ncbi:type II toxin-antitoxin system RelE/ParE family toxin [Gordonia phosphorivorans]|uniref:Type II toxin-antitoxin system RelE/ParE family toxin n=1 Tax=Gordonia phosphorivorans TaxID=1056982 RepID=A0ABV6H8B5_9ACTN